MKLSSLMPTRGVPQRTRGTCCPSVPSGPLSARRAHRMTDSAERDSRKAAHDALGGEECEPDPGAAAPPPCDGTAAECSERSGEGVAGRGAASHRLADDPCTVSGNKHSAEMRPTVPHKTPAELEAMSVHDLKAWVVGKGGSTQGCLEKSDLLDVALAYV